MVFKFYIPLTMSAGETIKVESSMVFYHSPTGVLISRMGFYPLSIKMGDKNNGRFRKNLLLCKKIIVVLFKYFIV
jgi:hypothetical protein